MADIQGYERVLEQDESVLKRSRILMIVLYGVIFTLLMLAAVLASLNPALLLLAPLGTAVAVIFSWKYTRVEYEYSFFGGVLTFSKIYSGSSRSTHSRSKTVFFMDDTSCSIHTLSASLYNIFHMLSTFFANSEHSL